MMNSMKLLIICHLLPSLTENISMCNIINYMLSSVFDVLSESITRGDDELSGTVKLLKTFVNEQTHCNALVRLLSFCVSFPVSEAIVELGLYYKPLL